MDGYGEREKWKPFFRNLVEKILSVSEKEW